MPWNSKIPDLKNDPTYLDGRLSNAETSLAEITSKQVVNVEDFTGANNLQKIQNAVNNAIANNKILEFTKVYDISGLGSINIIKTYPYKGTLYIVGRGGGIKKEDAGYIFANPVSTPMMSDFNIRGMYFESLTKTTATYVWNLDYFLRINSSNNTYNGIDSVFRADTVSAQSCRFTKESIRGGNDYAFYAKFMIDVTIAECLIEDRNSGYGYTGGGIANSVSSSNVSGGVSNFNIRIENNVIEGMDLAGAKLGTCVSSKISGNYMEANNGYFDLYTLVDAGNNSYALEFSANHIQQTTQQVTDNVPALKIKNILGTSSSSYKQKGNSFFSNNRALGILYEVDTNSYINSLGDFTPGTLICNPMTQLILVGGMNPLPVNGGTGALATIRSGVTYGFQKTFATTMNASTKQNYAIDVVNAYFYNPMTTNSVVSVTVSDITNIKVHAYNWVFKSSNIATLNVCLENIDTASHSITVYINVINLGD